MSAGDVCFERMQCKGCVSRFSAGARPLDHTTLLASPHEIRARYTAQPTLLYGRHIQLGPVS
jgi:hypothetical protein